MNKVEHESIRVGVMIEAKYNPEASEGGGPYAIDTYTKDHTGWYFTDGESAYYHYSELEVLGIYKLMPFTPSLEALVRAEAAAGDVE